MYWRRSLIVPGASALLALGLPLSGHAATAPRIVVLPTTTVSFTTPGCSTWTVPAGVPSVSINAVGAAGAPGNAPTSNAGGVGDGASATLAGLTVGQSLDVCVDFGGGAGSTALLGGGGNGGGASGVSTGATFASPIVVAGGGGGGGGGHLGPSNGSGGSAGSPVATAGSPALNGLGGGGGNNTLSTAGAAGPSSIATAGVAGGATGAAGPGSGGAGGATNGFFPPGGGGGGGGAGYFGGGGGGGGDGLAFGGAGGGGGTDLCTNGGSLSGCAITAGAGTQTVAGSAAGDAQVTITYTTPIAPAITSAAATTFTVGTAGTFAVTTTGFPSGPTLTLSDGGATLPSGVTFVDNGNGTATLAGTPNAGSAGSYPFTITAANGATPNATQSFVLTVARIPVTLSLSASSTTPTAGQNVTFTLTVTPTAGSAKPVGTATFLDGTTVLGTAPVDPGTAVFTTNALGVGTHSITVQYSGDSTFAAATSGSVLGVTVTAVPVPTTGAASPGGPINWPVGLLLLLSGLALVGWGGRRRKVV